MFDNVLQLLIPHYCCSCGEINSVLCEYCIKDIIDEPYQRCVVCAVPSPHGKPCTKHRLPYQRAWCVGERSDSLEKLINVSKFDSNRQGCLAQAMLLDQTLPRLPSSCVIVPIPTITSHIRQRGYGHAELIARALAKYRDCHYADSILSRKVSYTQHGASRAQRKAQAQKSYTAQEGLSDATTYLLIDDVYTTGYSVHYAAEALRHSGAKYIWVAVVARSML